LIMIGNQYPPASLQPSVAPKLQVSETRPCNEGILDSAMQMQSPRRSVGWSGSILRQRSQDDAARTGLASRGVWREMVSDRGGFSSRTITISRHRPPRDRAESPAQSTGFDAPEIENTCWQRPRGLPTGKPTGLF
jgi:hypothetical protein